MADDVDVACNLSYFVVIAWNISLYPNQNKSELFKMLG